MAFVLARASFAGYLMLIGFHNQTTWTIDKQPGLRDLVRSHPCWIRMRATYPMAPGTRASLAALCCAAALVYPAATSWQSAWQRYHAWPNANAFISAS